MKKRRYSAEVERRLRARLQVDVDEVGADVARLRPACRRPHIMKSVP